jgi:hypothetical protein
MGTRIRSTDRAPAHSRLRDLQGLTDDELQAEVTIAAAEPSRRAHRLEALLLELARRAPSVAA